MGRYVSLNAFFWGAVVALTAACTNFGGLITVRFLLGVAEGTISPAFVYITAMWWTREEIPARCGIWFAGNSLGGLLSNFLAFGIGHIKQPLAAWQWLFIVRSASCISNYVTGCWIYSWLIMIALLSGSWGGYLPLGVFLVVPPPEYDRFLQIPEWKRKTLCREARDCCWHGEGPTRVETGANDRMPQGSKNLHVS